MAALGDAQEDGAECVLPVLLEEDDKWQMLNAVQNRCSIVLYATAQVLRRLVLIAEQASAQFLHDIAIVSKEQVSKEFITLKLNVYSVSSQFAHAHISFNESRSGRGGNYKTAWYSHFDVSSTVCLGVRLIHDSVFLSRFCFVS